MPSNRLLANLEKLHTTELGILRIKKNLSLSVNNVVEWSKEKIKHPNASISNIGKNYYVSVDQYIITINAHSYTIITAHIKK